MGPHAGWRYVADAIVVQCVSYISPPVFVFIYKMGKRSRYNFRAPLLEPRNSVAFVVRWVMLEIEISYSSISTYQSPTSCA